MSDDFQSPDLGSEQPPLDELQVSGGLLDLSRQLRNILLMRPLFQLENNKLRVGEESRQDKGLLQNIDTHYLALAALDQMMETTLVS